MSTTRISLFDDMSNLFRGFDNIIHDPRRSSFPAVESFKRNDDLVLRAELPGIDPADVDVTVHDGQLILRGERKESQEAAGAEYYMNETFRGRFERTFMLPKGVKPEHVNARYEHGILEVVIPAKALEEVTRKVPIAVTEAQARIAS